MMSEYSTYVKKAADIYEVYLHRMISDKWGGVTRQREEIEDTLIGAFQNKEKAEDLAREYLK